jgi:hypothetical protein
LFEEDFRILDIGTRRKVKKLAVLIGDVDPPFSLEEWVSDFLRDFEDIEDLTLVRKNFQENEEDYTCPTIMDEPVDCEEACAIYENFEIYI